MPKVPISRRQVKEGRFQSKGVHTRASKGPNNQQALQQVGQILNQVNTFADKEKAGAQKVELDSFKTRLRKKQDSIIHDKDSGFYKLGGKDTTTSYDTFKDDFGSFADNELSTLGNDELKRRAQVSVDRFKMDVKRQLDGHTSREMSRYDDQQTEIGLASISEHTALNYSEQGLVANKFKESLAEQKDIISAYAERKGLSKEQEADMELKSSSRLYFDTANQMINKGEYLLAKDFIGKANAQGIKNKKPVINKDTNASLQKMLHSSTVKGESQRKTDEIMGKDLGLGASLEKARAIKDPEVRDATVARVRGRSNEKKLVKEESDKHNFNGIVEQIDKFSSTDHLTEQEKIKMTSAQKKVVGKMLDMISNGYKPTTDPRVDQDLMLHASSDPQSFMIRDINLSAHKLTVQRRQYFQSMQTSLRKADGKHDEDLGDFVSHQAQIKSNLVEHGITNDKKVAQFETVVRKEAVRWQKRNGEKKIPDLELQKIIDKQLAPTETDGFMFFEPNKRFFELDETDTISTYKGKDISDVAYEDIPPHDLNRFLKGFKRQNVEPTKQAVTKAFRKYLYTYRAK